MFINLTKLYLDNFLCPTPCNDTPSGIGILGSKLQFFYTPFSAKNPWYIMSSTIPGYKSFLTILWFSPYPGVILPPHIVRFSTSRCDNIFITMVCNLHRDASILYISIYFYRNRTSLKNKQRRLSISLLLALFYITFV